MSERICCPSLTRRQQCIGSAKRNDVWVEKTAGVRSEDNIPRRAYDVGRGGYKRLSIYFKNQTVAICVHKSVRTADRDVPKARVQQRHTRQGDLPDHLGVIADDLVRSVGVRIVLKVDISSADAAVSRKHAILPRIFERNYRIAASAFKIAADKGTEQVIVRVAPIRDTILRIELRALKVLFENDVDRCRNGIGAINRRSAVKYRLYPIDQRRRNNIEVDLLT